MSFKLIKAFIELCSKEDISSWAKQRNYDLKVLQSLNIGKCTLDIINKLMQDFGKEELIKQGFIKSGRHKFLNRIIIPYSNKYFAARREQKIADDKYKNLFLKGLKKEPFFIKGEDEFCYVVEGETTAIALKHLYPKVNIFSLGGSTSTNLLKDLKKYYKGEEVYLAFDNDEAGEKAEEKSIKLLCNNFKVSKLIIPSDFNDVDDYFVAKKQKVIKKDLLKIEKIKSSIKPIKEKKETKFSIEEGVDDGNRNNACFELALKYKKEKLKQSETLVKLNLWNNKNNPPLDEKEVRVIVERVYTYNPQGNFILNSDEIWENKLFSFDKLNSSVAYYGLLLPKKHDEYDNKGNYLYSYQKRSPAIITCDKKILPVNMRLQEDYKISIKNYPGELKLRWKLESINDFIKGNTKTKTFSEIFDLIKPQYEKFVSMQNIWMDIHTLWDIATYFFPLFKVFPIFELRGMRGTAKSKTMAISRLITLNATDIMINPSEPTLFRETNDKRPTKYIDEAENLFRMNKGQIEPDPRVEVINSSYRYDGCVPRQERIGGKFVTVYYYTYSPTMVGSINGLQGATEDRAIIRISTKPSKKDEYKGNLEPEPIDEIWQDIRNELYIAGLTYWKEILDLYNNTSNETKLKNRDYWIWKPILIFAKKISDELYNSILEQALKQQETKTSDYITDDSKEFKILEIMFDLLKESNLVYVKKIHEKLPESQYKPKEKTISTVLDKLGFRDHRDKDRNGSYFKIPHGIFEAVVMPICPSIFSSQSSQSSQKNKDIDNKKEIIDVMNCDECDESNKNNCDECDDCDECTNISTVDIKKKVKMLLENNNKIPIQDLIDNYTALDVSESKISDIITKGIRIGDWIENPSGFLQKI